MHRLKRKQQMAVIFAFYFFTFLVFFFFLILAIFRIVMFRQVQHDLSHEVTELRENHINEENGLLQFLKDEKGETLRTHLSSDNISAIFFNPDLSVIRKYGVFEQVNPYEEKEMGIIKGIIVKTLANLNSRETDLRWNFGKYYIYSLPITVSGKPIGAMVLAKSLDTIDKIAGDMLMALLPLGFIGLAGSLILGFYLSHKAFAPIGFIASQIEKIDLERLDKIIHISGNVNDEMVMLSDKFNRMIERVKEMSRRQKEFVSNASHELKTPLTKAISTLDIIYTQEPNTLTEVKKVKSDLLDLNDLLENLLMLSQLKESSFIPHSPSGIVTVYTKAKKKILDEALGKKIIFREKLIDFQVDIPPKYLEIILLNILGNAIKYSRMKSTVEIESRIEGKQAALSIRDHGYGFKMSEAEMMFNRYYRSGKTQKLAKGYGIGLPLVKELCHIYKIKIDLQSAPGLGTAFKLNFHSFS